MVTMAGMVGKVGKVGKVLVGKVLSCLHGISCDCPSTVDGKIFSVYVSPLFGLKKTDNLHI